MILDDVIVAQIHDRRDLSGRSYENLMNMGLFALCGDMNDTLAGGLEDAVRDLVDRERSRRITRHEDRLPGGMLHDMRWMLSLQGRGDGVHEVKGSLDLVDAIRRHRARAQAREIVYFIRHVKQIAIVR